MSRLPEKTFSKFIEENPVTAEDTGCLWASQEIDRLRRVDKDYKESLRMIEIIAAAGARLTKLASRADVEQSDVMFNSNDGMFCEEIAQQRIRWLLKCEDAIIKLAKDEQSKFDFVKSVLE